MRLKIFQINQDKDTDGVKFRSYKDVDKVDPSIYRKVFDAEADVEHLEDAFSLFNEANPHPLFSGHSLSVSDVVITDEGCYYCDSIGFKKIDFDESQVDTSEQIKVLFVQPHEKPYEAEIPDTLEAKQKAVGGLIEFVYNTDETALVCDEEAKITGKEGNRYLDGGGIIAGSFLVVGLGDEDCRSLTNEEVQKYMAKYSDTPDISPEETAADVGFSFIRFT